MWNVSGTGPLTSLCQKFSLAEKQGRTCPSIQSQQGFAVLICSNQIRTIVGNVGLSSDVYYYSVHDMLWELSLTSAIFSTNNYWATNAEPDSNAFALGMGSWNRLPQPAPASCGLLRAKGGARSPTPLGGPP